MKTLYLLSFLCLLNPVFSSTDEYSSDEEHEEVLPATSPSAQTDEIFKNKEKAQDYLMKLTNDPSFKKGAKKILEGIEEINHAAQLSQEPTKFQKTVNNLKAASWNLWDAVKGFVSAATDAAKETNKTVQEDIIPQAKEKATDAVNTVTDAWSTATGTVSNVFNTVKNTFNSIDKRFGDAEFNSDTDLSGAFD